MGLARPALAGGRSRLGTGRTRGRTVLPDPVLPDPVLPDPVLPDPVLPDPVLQDPVLPHPVLPDPVPCSRTNWCRVTSGLGRLGAACRLSATTSSSAAISARS